MSKSQITEEVRDEARDLIFNKRFIQEVDKKINEKVKDGNLSYKKIKSLDKHDYYQEAKNHFLLAPSQPPYNLNYVLVDLYLDN